jgi:hypothetical protein
VNVKEILFLFTKLSLSESRRETVTAYFVSTSCERLRFLRRENFSFDASTETKRVLKRQSGDPVLDFNRQLALPASVQRH